MRCSHESSLSATRGGCAAHTQAHITGCGVHSTKFCWQWCKTDVKSSKNEVEQSPYSIFKLLILSLELEFSLCSRITKNASASGVSGCGNFELGLTHSHEQTQICFRHDPGLAK